MFHVYYFVVTLAILTRVLNKIGSWYLCLPPPKYSDTSVLKHFGSWPSCSQKKCHGRLTKLQVLTLLPIEPFVLIPVWSVTRLWGNKGDWVFKQIASLAVFWNKLSWRSEIPLYKHFRTLCLKLPDPLVSILWLSSLILTCILLTILASFNILKIIFVYVYPSFTNSFLIITSWDS